MTYYGATIRTIRKGLCSYCGVKNQELKRRRHKLRIKKMLPNCSTNMLGVHIGRTVW